MSCRYSSITWFSIARNLFDAVSSSSLRRRSSFDRSITVLCGSFCNKSYEIKIILWKNLE